MRHYTAESKYQYQDDESERLFGPVLLRVSRGPSGWTLREVRAVDSAIQAARAGDMACQAIAFGWDASAYVLAREAARLGLAAMSASSN